MLKKENIIKENYSKNLKAAELLDNQKKLFDDEPQFLRFPLTFFYNVLHSGRFKGSRLLELGSGPVVYNVASASAFFQNIIMSDYVEDNCEELKRWLQGQSQLIQFLDIPAELEGYQTYDKNLEAGKKMLENRIRDRVKQVVRCDVLNEDIFLEEVKPEVAPPYDLIISSLCLCAATPNLDSYTLALKRINKLLRPGGGLILVGFFEANSWKVKENEFNCLQINEDDMRTALKESGFGNIDMKIMGKKINIGDKHDDFYCVAAEKLTIDI